MRLFYFSLLSLTSLNLAMEQNPDKGTELAVLTALTHKLSLDGPNPSLRRQSSPPIPIRSPKPGNQPTGCPRSSSPSTISENSLSSSPDSTTMRPHAASTVTPGTSPDSDSSNYSRYLYFPYPGSRHVEYR